MINYQLYQLFCFMTASHFWTKIFDYIGFKQKKSNESSVIKNGFRQRKIQFMGYVNTIFST